VPALYERKRNKINVFYSSDIDVNCKVNKIRAIYAYLKKKEFISIEIPADSITFIGDKWYMIFNSGYVISSCILEFDDKAKEEFEVVRESIQQNLSNSQIKRILR